MLKNGNYYKKYLKMRLDSAENEVDSVENEVDSVEIMVDSAENEADSTKLLTQFQRKISNKKKKLQLLNTNKEFEI